MTKWRDLRSMTLEELTDALVAAGEKPFRGRQVYDWLHRKLVRSVEEMRNVPASCRRLLEQNYPLCGVTEERRQVSSDGTMKFLFSLHDGNQVETVRMRYRHGNSVCISSQAGCRMGCRFCASAISGLNRNLCPSEMLDQVYAVQRTVGERISHVVVMGTGEPFDNFEALHRMIAMISDADGLQISRRNITVSTCGLVPQIYAFADADPQVTLAISLHAPNDELRRTLMPVANRYTIKELMEAADYVVRRTGRRVTFEYSLIRDVNDQPYHARELSALVKGKNCHINLIPVNPVRERDYRQSGRENVTAFRRILEQHHIQVTVRREMGSDISAACGQLRRSYKERSGKRCDPMD